MITPEQLVAMLDKATGGDPWYGSSTMSLVSSLTAAQAATRPVDDGHSIWETVLHLISWRNEVARRLGGVEPSPPLEGDWPEPGDATDAAWDLVKAELADSTRRLAERVAAFDPEAWSRAVGAERAPALGTGVSFAEMSAGILQHDAYHTGQIALLRKMLLAHEAANASEDAYGISLRPITRENVRACALLETNEDHARFVAPNAVSVAEAKVMPYLVPLGVYDGETMVGFAMYGRSPKDGRYFVVRLMIDARYIGKGYGKATMRALVDRMRRLPDCDEIYLSYVPGNVAAETLYLNLGFEKTGETDEDGEIYMRLRLDGDTQG